MLGFFVVNLIAFGFLARFLFLILLSLLFSLKFIGFLVVVVVVDVAVVVVVIVGGCCV